MFGIRPLQRTTSSQPPSTPPTTPAGAEDDFERSPQLPQARRFSADMPLGPRGRAPQPTQPPQSHAVQAATDAAITAQAAALRERFAAAGGDLGSCSAGGLARFGRFVAYADRSQAPAERLMRLGPWAAAACEIDENPFGLDELISLAAAPSSPGEQDPLRALVLLEPTLRGHSSSLPFWEQQTGTLAAHRVSDLLLRALADRLPVTCQLTQWQPEAAEALVKRMLVSHKDAESSLRLMQLAQRNALPMGLLATVAQRPTTAAQAATWLDLVRQLSPAEQLCVAENTDVLSQAASLVPAIRCLAFLESLPSAASSQAAEDAAATAAAAALRESVWKGMAPTAAATPEEAARWHKVLPKRPAWRNDWTTPVAILLPHTHWTLLARAGIEGRCLVPNLWPAPYGERGEALLACLENAIPASLSQAPELELVRDPAACVKGGDWSALLAALEHPPWLQALLHHEQPRADPDAAHAQQNRLQSLGRMLYALRCAGLDINTEPSPSVARILAHVPSQQHRQTLLKVHLRALTGAQAANWAARVAHIMDSYTSHEGRVLALVLEATAEGISRERPVQALLNCTALTHDGRAWQRLFNLFAGPQEESAAFGRHVARWPTGENLLQMLPHSMRTDSPLALAQAYAEDPQQATALRVQCQRSDATSKVAAALVAEYHSQGLTPRCIPAYLNSERQRLGHSLQWLATQAGYAPVAHALVALLQLSAPNAAEAADAADTVDAAGTAPSAAAAAKARAKARNAAIAAAKTQARTAHGQAPRGPLRAWADVLAKQVERCIPPAVRQRPAQVEGAPAASFYEQTPVRQFFNQHVLALALGLQEFAGILARLNVDVDSLHSPAAVRGRALELFGEEGQGDLWERMQKKLYKPEIFLMYTALSSEWSYQDIAHGLPDLRQVTKALLDGTYPQLRRTSAQMQPWLQSDTPPAWLNAWETDPQPQRAATQGEFTLQDTADPGKMLHATTEISSCQSIYGGRLNVGMLGRMLCGSKRMLLMHDSAGKLEARAMLRLLRDENGQPVIGLSKIYSAHGSKHTQALEAYALQRARALGLRAARTYAVFGPCQAGQPLHSAAAKVPDYWDDTEVLSDQAQTVKGEILS